MYGIVGEDPSDVNTLEVLVRSITGDYSIPVEKKGFRGCGEMLRKGAAQLTFFKRLQCTRFIVCHDADGHDPARIRDLVRERIVNPSGIARDCCILVPVQELEAWILADIECATKIFRSWYPPAIPYPERIAHPKEYIEKLSRDGKNRPRYHHVVHNQQMAKNLDIHKVRRKCPSFGVLFEFVVGNG